MNTKNITITVGVIAVLALAFILYPKQNNTGGTDTPIEVLDKSTQDDTTSDIEADLNSIDVNATSDDFNAMDAEINSL